MKQNGPHHKWFFFALIPFSLALALHFFISKPRENNEQYLNDLELRCEEQIKTLVAFQQNLWLEVQQSEDSLWSFRNDYPSFIYKHGQLVYWTDYLFVPQYVNLPAKEGLSFSYLGQGDYLVYRNDFEDSLTVVSILPVSVQYRIDNKYLESGLNRLLFNNQDAEVQKFAKDQREWLPVVYQGKPIFMVKFGANYTHEAIGTKWFITGLILTCVVFLLLYLISWIRFFRNHRAYEKGFLVLFFGLIFLRAVLIYIVFPFSWVQLALFNPLYFNSLAINPSLGDLFLNELSLLIIVMYILFSYPASNTFKKLLKANLKWKTFFSVLFIALSYFFLFHLLLIIRTFYSNTQWSLDITASITFPVLKLVCYLVYVLASLSYVLATHVLFKTVVRMNGRNETKMFISVLGGVFLFVLICNLNRDPFIVVALLHSLYLILLNYLRLTRYLVRVQYMTFVYFITAAFIGSLLGGSVILSFEKEKVINEKHRFANQLLLRNDVLGEFLLSEMMQGIAKDADIKATFLASPVSDKTITDRIRRTHLSNYFDKYDVTIHVFDADGNTMEQPSRFVNIKFLKFYYNSERNRTEYENIFFVSEASQGFSKMYVSFIDFEIDHKPIGSVFIELRLKKIIPNSVYPELLLDKRFIQPSQYAGFSYAIFDRENLILKSGEFNYNRDFLYPDAYNSLLFEEGIVTNGLHHLAIRADGGRVIVITSEFEPWNKVVSNFSFLLLMYVFLFTIALLVWAIRGQTTGFKLNFTGKIQLYLNLAFVVPMIIITLTTLSLVTQNYNENVTQNYFDKAQSIERSVEEKYVEFLKNRLSIEALVDALQELARNVQVDINLYNTQGELVASSQSNIYQNNVLSSYANPIALREISQLKNHQIILDEHVGKLEYKSVYVGVKSYSTGANIGILSIPYFESRNDLEQMLIAGFADIINVFTFVLLVLLAVSYMASRFLTEPLRLIARHLSYTSLGDNEPIKWKSDDEIGLMVGEYNKMLIKLDDSKATIAQNEKESAWREMAKQVAHEIKNPLTPMKLTLQHMERKINELPEEVQELKRPVASLLKQIETLNDIATSFSAFATMPIPINKRFELSALVQQTVAFHNKEFPVKVDMPKDVIFIMGDAQLMSRIISNLLINAKQSIPDENETNISLTLSREDKRAQITIKDNGSGIAEEIAEKVFVPNFTTKATGSGIGLAIAKRGVEHAGGSIWFESKEGEGTCFYIELPIIS